MNVEIWLGSKAVNLTGTVSVDGTPVADGFLSITPVEGGRGTGVRVPITVGKCRVSFTAVQKTGKKTTGMAGEEVDEQVSVIPEKYNSGLDIEITADQSTLDFLLISE